MRGDHFLLLAILPLIWLAAVGCGLRAAILRDRRLDAEPPQITDEAYTQMERAARKSRARRARIGR